MTTPAEIEDTLPWGFHDAYLEGLAIDWLKKTVVLDLRVMMSEEQDLDQRARLIVSDLVFCSVQAPEIDPARRYEPTPEGGLWIDGGEGIGTPSVELPKTPEGCFLHWFFVQPWNRFIHVCARSAELQWVESEPQPSRASTRALHVGSVVADP